MNTSFLDLRSRTIRIRLLYAFCQVLNLRHKLPSTAGGDNPHALSYRQQGSPNARCGMHQMRTWVQTVDSSHACHGPAAYAVTITAAIQLQRYFHMQKCLSANMHKSIYIPIMHSPIDMPIIGRTLGNASLHAKPENTAEGDRKLLKGLAIHKASWAAMIPNYG